MARRQSGGFNKFLNFIGLVDDAAPERENEYASEGYGRPATYVPQSQRANARTTPQQPRPAQQPARRGLSGSGSQTQRTYGDDRYGTSRSYGDELGYTSGRAYAEDDYRSARRSTAYGSGYAAPEATARPAASASRTRSRFEEEPPRRIEAPAPAQPARVRVSRPQRTIMRSLISLEDCCDVIDNLVRGNTIVLTLDDLDGLLMQRCVDTLSGAVFALHATIRKASDRTYLIAPSGVEVDETYDVDRRF